jgi:phosphoribosylamine--glycine ligase
VSNLESILLIGGGGREHAFALEMSKSLQLGEIAWATGSPAIDTIEKAVDVASLASNTDDIVRFATEKKSGLTVVIGPEAPLVGGLSDKLRQEGISVFGPSATAAQLEGSKAFASEFMQRHDIPQPKSVTVRNAEEAFRELQGRLPETIVLKADGLAGGKGVVLPTSQEEMMAAVASMFNGSFDNAAANGVVIQERLSGPEVSVFVISDGENYSIVPFFAQDHKRLGTGNVGPNTGGMGTYTPVPAEMINEQQLAKIQEIADKTIKGMAAEGTPYQGVLYMGLMLAQERDGDPIVIEYNVRFGDPEAQVVLSSLTDSGVDVYEMIRETAAGRVPDLGPPQFLGRAALSVCLASEGYPEAPKKGAVIHGLDKTYSNVTIHHGGTKRDGDNIIVNGGRVLYVTGRGESVDEAAAAAYAAIGEDGIHFEGMQYRTDIGYQARKL